MIQSHYIIHPSAKKPGKVQMTMFIRGIPYSDMCRDTLVEIIDELVREGFYHIESEI